jgi:glutaredoxin 3
MVQVVMYMTEHCPYCIRARRLLRDKGVEPTEIPVDRDHAQLDAMVERSGRHTVPQIFIGDIHVGGYDDLARLDDRGGLDPLLGA